MPKVKKAHALKNANISFVSLVDKAANQKQFAIIKNDKGFNMERFSPIIKVNDEEQVVTSVVYEPDVEDSQGDFMTAEAIEKAARTFMMNGANIDIQHNFEKADSVHVVESWITKNDETIGEQEIKKGTWMMSTYIDDETIWEQVKKGDITGFSMGGVAERDTEDVDLDSLGDEEVQKGFVNKIVAGIQKAFGITKGEFADKFNERAKRSNFWTAFNSLEDVLYKYDWWSEKGTYEEDPEKIREALEEFGQVVTDLLTKDSIELVKSIGQKPEGIEKAGKKISAANQEKIQTAYNTLGEIIESTTEEDDEVKKEDINKITEAVTKALKGEPEPTPAPVVKEDTIDEKIEKAVTAALANLEKQAEPATEDIDTKIANAVAKAMEPLYKSRGISQQIVNDDQASTTVTKSDKSYINTIAGN